MHFAADLQRLRLGQGGNMCCEQDDAVVVSKADWLADLSERARAQGDRERADHLLLLAWQAYDGQEVSLGAVNGNVAGGDQECPRAGATTRIRTGRR